MISETGRRATYLAGAPLNEPSVPIGHFVDLKIRDHWNTQIGKSSASCVIKVSSYERATARTIEDKL